MKVMLLTAGKGTRLRPLTKRVPKALVPIGKNPLLEYTLSWLARQGVTEVVVNLYHLGDLIERFVGDGGRWGLKAAFSCEESLLGTAGAVKHVARKFTCTFAVVYGDILTDMDLRAMLEYHHRSHSLATIAVQEVDDIGGKGVVGVGDQGRVTCFLEKPLQATGSIALVNAGVYVLEPQILEFVAPGCSDFGSDVFPKLLELALPIYAWQLRPWEYLVDIGTFEAYRRANVDVANGRITLAPSSFPR